MEDDSPDGERLSTSNVPGGKQAVPVDRLPDNGSLAVAQERIRGLEELVELLKEQLEVERERYAGLLKDLRTGRLLEPRTERQHSWMQFWKDRN